MQFDVARLNGKYNSKKQNAKNKGIEFTLTKEQYRAIYLAHDGYCDYTGKVMSTVNNSNSYVTLERIDSNIGYTPSNICLIRADVNQLKGLSFDKAAKEDFTKSVVKADKIDVGLLVKLCDTLYNPDKIQAIKDKYAKLFDNHNAIAHTTATTETHKQEEFIVTQETNTFTPKNAELTLTKSYYDFGSQIESLDVEFTLSFSEYKRLVSRKYCQLSDKLITPENCLLWVVDKTLPVSKNNVLAVDKNVGEGLDKFMVYSDLNLFTLKKLCKNLIAKGE